MFSEVLSSGKESNFLYANANTRRACLANSLFCKRTFSFNSFVNSSTFPFIKIYLQLSITMSGAPFVAEITFDEKIFSLNVVIIFLVESKGISAILL